MRKRILIIAAIVGGIVLLVLAIVFRGSWLAMFQSSPTETSQAEPRMEEQPQFTELAPRPEAAAIDQDVSTAIPLFDVVRIAASGEVLVAGRSPKNALVSILIDGDDVGEVEADEQGRFVFLFEEALEPGEYQMALRAEDADGKFVQGQESIVILIPFQPLEVSDKEQVQQPLIVLVPGDDSKVATLLQKQYPIDKAPLGPHFTVDTVEYNTETAKLAVTGDAYGDALTLVAYIDNQPLALTRIQGMGSTPTRWQISGIPDTIPGMHELRVDMVVNNRVVLRRLLKYNHPAVSEFDMESETVKIVRGDTLWGLATRLLGRGYRYVVIFEENRDQLVDPDLIYPGQILKVPIKNGVAPLDLEAGGGTG